MEICLFSLLIIVALAGGADRLWPVPLRRLQELSVTVTDRDDRPLRVFTTSDGTWRLPAEKVSPLYLALLLDREDRRFFRHPGVDARAVARAILQNLRAGRVVSGASTLTQQVARLLEPHPRTVLGKLREMLRALQLEWHYDKQTILNYYLTLAPFGGNIEGIQAASRLYFAKAPDTLTLAEAALLVALPQAPEHLRPDRFPEASRAVRQRVLHRAEALELASPASRAEAEQEPLPRTRHPLPALAPHFTQRVRQDHPGQTVIRSSLDAVLQTRLEALAQRELPGLPARAGLALLVVDNAERTIRAAVGAPDPGNDSRQGWVDMTRRPRSPGSALKPLLYALGFDERLIHPETLVADVSTRFGDYAPANFDRGFHGELTIREALQRSLNIPAVIVLDLLGPRRVSQRLRGAGITLRLPRGVEEPGLPLALGGVGLTLSDLVQLYAGLARGGEVGPLGDHPPAPDTLPAPGVRLVSAESAALVLRILEDAPAPPGMVGGLGDVLQRRPPAMKTGTSFGFRDAWAVAVAGRWTVGVWVGRPDGTPLPERYGIDTAAPILWHICDLFPAADRDWVAPGADSTAAALPGRPPDLLRRVRAGHAGQRPLTLPDPQELRLVFPTPGLVVERPEPADPGSPPSPSSSPLRLVASGGRRPLTWLADGRVLGTSTTHREFLWSPPGPGFTRITVVDADGRSATAAVELRSGPAGEPPAEK